MLAKSTLNLLTFDRPAIGVNAFGGVRRRQYATERKQSWNHLFDILVLDEAMDFIRFTRSPDRRIPEHRRSLTTSHGLCTDDISKFHLHRNTSCQMVVMLISSVICHSDLDFMSCLWGKKSSSRCRAPVGLFILTVAFVSYPQIFLSGHDVAGGLWIQCDCATDNNNAGPSLGPQAGC